MKPPIRFLGSAAVLLLGLNLSFAQQQPTPSQDKAGEKSKEEKKPPAPEEKIVQTKHSLKIGGQEIKYTATAGTILLKLEDGTPKASIFYVAYTKDDVGDASQRPLTFSFNGGPGSASVWLHLGLFGPRRISSVSTPRATSVGLRRNSLPAKATAQLAPQAFPAISSSATACISTASS